MPMFLEYPVKDRASWKEYKKRLDPATPGRYPDDWDAYVWQINEQAKEIPISLQVGGFFGYLREWMGLEPLLYMFYDDPELVEEMMDAMLYLEM
jgi:uroporphyrinogen decarboxylase